MIAESLLPEYDHEMKNTRAILERIPDAVATWTPHQKSTPLGKLSSHVSVIPDWAERMLRRTEYDLAHQDNGPSTEYPEFVSTDETLKRFDESVAKARAVIAATSDEEMMVPWTFKKNGKDMMTLPRIAAVRFFLMNHLIHHRGQLGVYLRLNDVPLPGIYGPTADTM